MSILAFGLLVFLIPISIYLVVLGFAENRTRREDALVWAGKAALCLVFMDVVYLTGTVFIPAVLVYIVLSTLFLYCSYQVWLLRHAFTNDRKAG